MSRKSHRPKLHLTPEEIKELRVISQSRTRSQREVERAHILLCYYGDSPIQEISRQVGVSRPAIYKCIDKALAMGVKAALADLYHRPKSSAMTLEAKAWVTSLACTKLKDLGWQPRFGVDTPLPSMSERRRRGRGTLA